MFSFPDKATVPIYYENRIAKLGLNTTELPKLDVEFEAITEGEGLIKKVKLKTKWAALDWNAKQKHPSPDFVPRTIRLSSDEPERGINPGTSDRQFIEELVQASIFSCANEKALALIR